MNGWQTVRVFISSTFSDMHAERDYLICEVFPLLREWCVARRIHLIAVDLRWGVTEEEAQTDSKLIEKCLGNIDRCYPFFLCLMGQRRGFIPMIQGETEELLNRFPSLKAHAGERSITELEIAHAVEHNTNPDCLLLFQREPDYLEHISDLALLRRIYTGNDEGNPEKMLFSLPRDTVKYSTVWDKSQRTPQIAMPTYCNSQYPEIKISWRKKWIDAGIPVPDGCTSLDGSLLEKAEKLNKDLTQGRLTKFEVDGKSLGAVICDALCKAIIQEYPDHAEPVAFDSQDAFVEQERFYYIMPKEAHAVLDAYAESDERIPLLIVSPSGYGKTALLANWSTDVQHLRVIKGFAEAGVYDDLPSFAGGIAARMNTGGGKGNIFQTPMETLLSKVTTGTVLIIDGWDHLDPALESGWLQRKLIEGVKLIVSLNSNSPRAAEMITFLKEEGLAHVYDLPCLSLSDKQKLIDTYLDQFLKKLDEEFIKTLISQPAANNPLYLRTGLSLLRIHNSYESLGGVISSGIGSTLSSAIRGTLARLFELPQISDVSAHSMVSCLFPLICSARHTLCVSELAETLAVMPAISSSQLARNPEMLQQEINRLLHLSEAIVRRVGIRYMPACKELADVCTEMFTLQMSEAHEALVHLYRHQMSNSKEAHHTGADRAVLNIVHHLFAFDSAEAMALLTNPSFLKRRINLGFIGALSDDFSIAATYTPLFGEFSSLLDSYHYILQEHPESFVNLLFFYGSPEIKAIIERWLQKGLLPEGLIELDEIDLPQPPDEASSRLSVEILYRSAGWSPLAYACSPKRRIFFACLYIGELTVLDDSDSESFSIFQHSLKFPIDQKPLIRVISSKDGERIAVMYNDGTFACYRIRYDAKNMPIGLSNIYSGEYQKGSGVPTAIGWASHTLVWQKDGALKTFDTDTSKEGELVSLEGELAFVGEGQGNIFLVINGRSPRYLIMDRNHSLHEIGVLPCPALAAACQGDTYVVAAWNGEVHIHKNGKESNVQMRQPVRSCAITEDGVVCIDMQNDLSFIAWDGTVSALGLAPEEAAGNGCLMFSNRNMLMAVSDSGRCRFSVDTGNRSSKSIQLLSGGHKRALFLGNIGNEETIWLVDQQTRETAYFFHNSGGEYVSNALGELCSDRSYGFHEWLPNTLNNPYLPWHILPVIRLDEHILFSVNRKAGGFYLFSEKSIYRLHIRNKLTDSTLPADDETTYIKLATLEPGLMPVRAAVSGQNILLLGSQTIPMQQNLDVILLLYESEQGDLISIARMENHPSEELDLNGCRYCDDGMDGFYIGSKTGLFHISGDGTLQSLDAQKYYPIKKMCFVPNSSLFYIIKDELCSFNVKTRQRACFYSLDNATDLAVWGNDPVMVLGNKKLYRINWRL